MATGTYDDKLDADLDRVRFLVRDTDGGTNGTAFNLSDDEINWLLTEEADLYLAAAAAARTLGAKHADGESKTVGPFSISHSNTAQGYEELAQSLERRSQRHAVPTPYAGGIRKSDMATDEADDDLYRFASRGQHDHRDGGDFTRSNPE